MQTQALADSKILKREFILEGLGCANCAGKMEVEINKLPHVRLAIIDFINKKLIIEAHEGAVDDVIKEAEKIIKRIEPEVEIIARTDKKTKAKETYFADNIKEVIRLAIGAVFFAAAVIFDFTSIAELVLYLISYLLIGGEILLKAVRNISRGQVFDENFLMSLATIGAFAIGEFPEGVAVMLFYQIGELFQDYAVDKSRKSITELMDIRPEAATIKEGSFEKVVSPENVSVGSIIIVKPGEKIPLDGTVLEGTSMVDTSALTGESVPREVQAGSSVLSGFINKNGLLLVKVTKEYGESTVAKILDLVENAGAKKAPTENFITKFARYYTPGVVLIALGLAVIPPLLLQGATFSDWIYRALIFLVVSCPCALVISIPLGFFGGIGAASRQGILVKGGNYLEALNSVDTIVFDKTGTLTQGIFSVTGIHPAGSMSENELLEYAAYAESLSNHPIAVSILKAYGQNINKDEIKDYNEIPGHGIKMLLKGKAVAVGNGKLMLKENIEFAEPESTGTIVHVGIDGVYGGYIAISDTVKSDAAAAVAKLKAIGIKKCIMLTGDNKNAAEKAALAIGIDEVHSQLLPDQKVEKLEEIFHNKTTVGKTAFVGDGVNDAPVLARADVGIAMGGLGSDAAIEAADVVIMTDEPSKIVTAIKIALKTKSIVWQNIIFALGVKLIVLVLGAGGIATMWEAVFADVGVALIAVLNAIRIIKTEKVLLRTFL